MKNDLKNQMLFNSLLAETWHRSGTARWAFPEEVRRRAPMGRISVVQAE